MPHVLHLAPEVVKIDLQTPFPVAHIIYNIVGQKTFFLFFFHHMVLGVNRRQDLVPFSLGFYVLNPTHYEMKAHQ